MPRKSVLLIEDHQGVSLALTAALRNDGRFEPYGPAATLAEGLRLLETSDCCDAVVLDLTLKNSQGVETLRRLRAAVPTAAIIVYSAVPMMTADEAEFALADAVIPKGEITPLLDALERLTNVGKPPTA
jgi:DNA-binding NarL/FixJ family response regulator